jgi:glycine/D-amino acid oxidase-like deaminating enzyme
VPERRRAVVIGGGRTGIAAAFHLGEHCLLIERRVSLEDSHDHPYDYPMGAASRSALGIEATAADRDQRGVTSAERRALFISCSSSAGGDAHDRKLIHIECWRPPELTTMPVEEHAHPPSARALIPLLRGERRLGTSVVRISPLQHRLELENGGQIIYDRLLSTLVLPALARLVAHELPVRVRCDEILRYWLGENDIEVADYSTQEYFGDLDELAAGKRVADQMTSALRLKFHGGCRPVRGARLFTPRLVQDVTAQAMS